MAKKSKEQPTTETVTSFVDYELPNKKKIKVSCTNISVRLTKREEEIVLSSDYNEEDVTHLFKEKYHYLENIDFFKRALFAISSVHEFGANKYSYYSHQNVPHLSDNVIDAGIEAVKRHFELYRTGNQIDDSGINHIAHICCRGGSMLLTRFYRLYMRAGEVKKGFHRDVVEACMKNVRSYPHPDDTYPVYIDQITPEVMISMIKFKPEYIPDQIEACFDVIAECLFALEQGRMLANWDPYNDISYVDLILWCATKILNTLPETENQCLAYLEKIK